MATNAGNPATSGCCAHRPSALRAPGAAVAIDIGSKVTWRNEGGDIYLTRRS